MGAQGYTVVFHVDSDVSFARYGHWSAVSLRGWRMMKLRSVVLVAFACCDFKSSVAVAFLGTAGMIGVR